MKLLILLATAFAVTGYAMTIKLSDETVLNDVEVTGVSSRGISLLCSDGVRCLLPSEISRNSQEQLAGEIKQYQKLAEQLSQREREGKTSSRPSSKNGTAAGGKKQKY